MRYLLAGESHGPALVGIIEGLPAGLAIPQALVDEEMARRREGHGRGGRARDIEADRVGFLAGFWNGVTLGSPLAFVIENQDFVLRSGKPAQRWTVPRPGHADFVGLVKYGYDECAPAAERASARTTAGLVAVGACAKALLGELGIEVLGHVVAIGDVTADPGAVTAARLRRIQTGTPVRCLDRKASTRMVAAIDAAAAAGTTLGGVFEIVALGLPVGLGSFAHPDRRLDAQLAADVMAIPSVKAVEVGDGVVNAARTGHEAHDALRPDRAGPRGVGRADNRAGGLEGGVTNGAPLRVRGYAKPIATVRGGLPSVDLASGKATSGPWVRSDTCVVPAAGAVAEAVVAWRLACAAVDALGGDRLGLMRTRCRDLRRAQRRPPTKGRKT